MFWLILKRSLLQQGFRAWRVVFAVALGTAVATAVLGASIGISDQVHRELLSYGANIEVIGKAPTPEVHLGGIRYRVSDEDPSVPVDKLGALKTTFWRNNIVGFAPFLSTEADLGDRPVKVVGAWFRHTLPVDGKPFSTGLQTVEPWWRVVGRWPGETESDTCLVGDELAHSLGIGVGDSLHPVVLGRARTLRCVGIARTGGPEEAQLIVPLSLVQSWVGAPGRAERVEVSAIIKPDDALAHKDPSTLSDADRERFVCSPYMGAITSSIQQVLPGVTARPIYRVADSQGKLLSRVQLLMTMVLVAALVAAMLGAGAATAAAAIDRREEVGLVKALGARSSSLLVQLGAEALVLGLAGGIIGVPCGVLLEIWIGREVFGAATTPPWIVLPVGLALASTVAMIASLAPLWSAQRLDPVQVLGENN